MSYARFGWEDSDVYIILCTGGYLDCCGCIMLDLKSHVKYMSTAEMLAHLDAHEAAGHTVPASCREELIADAKENDLWILERRDS